MAWVTAAIAVAGLLGSLFSRRAQGAAAERQTQTTALENAQRAAQQVYATQQAARANLSGLQEQATMNRAQLGITAPSARTRQALLGSLLQNIQAARVTAPEGVNMGTITGGLTPDAISAATRAGGGELEKQALLALLTKSDIPGPTDYVKSGMLQAPNYGSSYLEPGRGESVMSALGMVGQTIGAIGALNQGGGGGATLPATYNQNWNPYLASVYQNRP